MYILGLNCYSHEASCALIKDGKIRYLIEEERLNREKHTWKYPANAIAKCLSLEGISITEVDHVAFFLSPLRDVFGNLDHVIRYFPQSLNLLNASTGGGDQMSQITRLRLQSSVGKHIAQQFRLKKKVKVHYLEHHLVHAASAYFVSPFEEAAILTVDGHGECTTTLMSLGQGNKIKKLMEVRVPHSLGHLYGSVTEYLGFKKFFDEWKVMGMSAYGAGTCLADFEKIVRLFPGGGFALDLNYFRFHTHGQRQSLSDLFYKTFGPRRQPNEPLDQRHYDIAYALQRMTEKAGVHLANGIYERTKSENLCMTGGVVLNCLMNKRIVEETPFKQFFFQPIANDAGTSLGAALYYYHQVLGFPRQEIFNSAYLGMEFSNDQIEPVLKEAGVAYERCGDIARRAAEHMAHGKVVGWFQGRMEAGPRALGHRSIVADPTDPTIRDRMNARVKHREMFRPFAPSVLEENAADYFVMPKNQPSPYMILIGDVRGDKKQLLPAVTHHDGTARVHTVSKQISPKFWNLINEFGKIKGIPVVLNTSFNEQEPIVCTPQDALNCFLRTEIDVLAIGDFLVKRQA